jgi:N-methylhydantoinase A
MTHVEERRVRVGVDVGGTFTDLVAYDEEGGELLAQKVLTTSGEPSEGVLEALRRSGIRPSSVADFIHGTTSSTNAVIEGTTSPTALLTTRGFRDVLELMRGDRPLPVYDMSWRKPDPLVPRNLRCEADERVDAQGRVLRPLDLDGLRDLLRSDALDGVEAVAVSFLHSFLHDRHERQAAALIAEERPELMVSLSCDVNPEVREYERASTVALDAMLKPLMSSYLRRLEQGLRDLGVAADVFVMLANAGVMPIAGAESRPIYTLHSGPAGGVVGAALVGGALGRQNLITADMGGTSFDVCTIRAGRPRFRPEGFARWGIPFRIPLVDIGTIGAGGGSVAWIDPGGLLRVGPRSAGASPGPACYGLGAGEATVTDACCVLGYLGGGGLGGDAISLRPALALEALERLARRLGQPSEDVAEGILRIAVATMAAEIRKNSVERGDDPRDFSLFSFGGAGSMFAGLLARELGMREVIVPPRAGVFSAYGMLGAEWRCDVRRSVYGGLDRIDKGELSRAFGDLEAEARARLGSAGEQASVGRQVSLRYVGQRHELEVPLAGGAVNGTLADARAEFDRLHAANYGHERPGDPVEVRAVAVVATIERPKPRLVNPGDRRPEDAVTGRRSLRLVGEGARRDAPVYTREQLMTAAVLEGPAILESRDATVVVYEGQRARVHSTGSLLIEG